MVRHRIPVWYKGEEIYVGQDSPNGAGWKQDPDTLDTWFSSGLWTFSTLGWPNEKNDLKKFHPTSVINPGYEILFFWVARMILMSQYLIGEIHSRLYTSMEYYVTLKARNSVNHSTME